MAKRTETIGVRVTPAEKEKFDSYAEEHNEFDSASRMLRVLAHRHIASDGQDESIDTDEIVDAVSVSMSDVHERLDRLEDHILSIDSHTSDEDEVDKLARDIFSSLPVHSDASELPDMFEIARQMIEDDFTMAQSLSTPSAWANYYDVEVATARRACARMLDYYPDVEFSRVEMGDVNVPIGDGTSGDISVSERRYFRTEGE